MAITADYWVHCDGCGDSTEASQPTPADALDYAERGDWTVSKDPENPETFGSAVCPPCAEGRSDGQG